MPTEVLRCSAETQPYFNELPMPKGLNGNEDYLSKYDFNGNVHIAMEVFRRIQDLHDAINAGRFFLCEAQRSSFSEIYKEPSPKWANDWIKAQFITSAIESYNSAFDLFLQVNWLYFELFKTEMSNIDDLTTDNLKDVLRACSVFTIIGKCKNKIVSDIYNAIVFF